MEPSEIRSYRKTKMRLDTPQDMLWSPGGQWPKLADAFFWVNEVTGEITRPLGTADVPALKALREDLGPCQAVMAQATVSLPKGTLMPTQEHLGREPRSLLSPRAAAPAHPPELCPLHPAGAPPASPRLYGSIPNAPKPI